MIQRTKQDRIELFLQMTREVFPPEALTRLSESLDAMGYFDAPASAKYHGNYPGGLFDHSYEVARALINLTQRLDLRWQRRESPYIASLLHDLCKCDQFIFLPDGRYGYAKNLELNGHGEKSVILAKRLLDLTEEEELCIRWHMGAYDDSENWNPLGAAIEKYPNVLYTHTADMIAARIIGI